MTELVNGLMIRWLILFSSISFTTLCQQRIDGVIVDQENGQPVAFASISVIGTTKGTSSNIQGQFSISVTEPFSLQVTCIGYESQVITSAADAVEVRLKPVVKQLAMVVISNKKVKPKSVVTKALASIPDNYNQQPFLQKFFYRHYCKDDGVYGRLIEAAVEVWKNKGYRGFQSGVGANEELRITQLRRSLDRTSRAQGHEPISVKSILETDLIGYQSTRPSEHLNFFTNVSELRANLPSYDFTFRGFAYYEGLEVYEIAYLRKDSLLTTSGNYTGRSQISGELYITTDSFAIIRNDEVKSTVKDTVRTSVFYKKYGDKYYPYHFKLDGENLASDSSTHLYHIELVSTEVSSDPASKFTGQLPGAGELFNIPYDSTYWNSSVILKTTPLEDQIIDDLGGGVSLDKQFYRYKQYHMNVTNGGQAGDKKFDWLRLDSRGNRILYLVFWSTDFQSYLAELELTKRLARQFGSKISFVFLSLDDDEIRWQQIVERYALFSDGIINYRVGRDSQATKDYSIKETPSFVLLGRSDDTSVLKARRPSDPLLASDLTKLLQQK